MDYGIVIEKIHQELKAYWGKGKVADYIPALAEVEPNRDIGRTLFSGRRCGYSFFYSEYL